MPGLYSHTTRSDGLTLTAAIYNADHQNHIDNFVPSQMDDYSSTTTEMRTTTDPGESGSESLPTTMAGELERLRYIIKEMHGGTYWYTSPLSKGASELTIASGVITLTSNIHSVDTESDAASNDLVTITAPLARTGDVITLYAENAGRLVRLAPGGNIGRRAVLQTNRPLRLVLIGSTWYPTDSRWLVDYKSIDTANNVDVVDLTDGLKYVFEFVACTLNNDAINLFARMSDDNGATFESGAADYYYGDTPTSADNILLLTSVGAAAGEGFSGSCTLWYPQSTSHYKLLTADMIFVNSSGEIVRGTQSGGYRFTTAVDGIRFALTVGGTMSGTLFVYAEV